MTKNDDIIKHWQNIHHAEGLHPQETGLFAEILVEKARNSSEILEIGVGHGRMIRYLLNQGVEKSKIYSIDIIENEQPLSQFHEKADLIEYASRENNISKFDLVYSLGVIEHGEDIYKLFKSQLDLVKPGGLAMYTVPALSIETFIRVWSYYRKKLYLSGAFNQIKGKNLTLRNFRNFCNRYGIKNENVIMKRTGQVIRYKNYGEKFKGYEEKLGSSIIVIIKK